MKQNANTKGTRFLSISAMAVLLASSMVWGQSLSLEEPSGDATASLESYDPMASTLVLRDVPRQREVAAGLTMFNNLEEAAFAEAGSKQLEQTFDTSFRTQSDHSFAGYAGATSLYWAPTERLTLGFTFAELSYENSDEFVGMRYDGSGISVLYSLIDPTESAVGVAVYSRVLVNERFFANDSRLVLQVLRGPWNLVYNLRIGTDVDGLNGGGNNTTGTLGHTFGAAYAWEREGTIKEVSLALEALVDSTYNEWDDYDTTVVYAGPTLGLVIGERWSVTLTGAAQLTDEDSPDWTTQLTVGWVF